MIRKRIAAGVVLGLLWLAAIAIVTMPGCASVPMPGEPATARAQDAARIIVRAAALAYIEQAPRGERALVAVKVLDVTGAILAELGNGEPVSVQDLQVLALKHLPADLSPARRVVALELIDTAVSALVNRSGVGDLRSNTLVRVGELLGWVADVARLYAPPSASG